MGGLGFRFMGIDNIKEAEYVEENNSLTVVYGGGSVIEYKPIMAEVYAEAIREQSLQRAIHSMIRHNILVGVRKARG